MISKKKIKTIFQFPGAIFYSQAFPDAPGHILVGPIWTSWHLIIEGGENSRYIQDLIHFQFWILFLWYKHVLHNLKKIKIERWISVWEKLWKKKFFWNINFKANFLKLKPRNFTCISLLFLWYKINLWCIIWRKSN